MLLSNKIAGFCGHHYLWKETPNVLDFLCRDSNQGEIVCKSTTAGLVWLDMPRHA